MMFVPQSHLFADDVTFLCLPCRFLFLQKRYNSIPMMSKPRNPNTPNTVPSTIFSDRSYSVAGEALDTRTTSET